MYSYLLVAIKHIDFETSLRTWKKVRQKSFAAYADYEIAQAACKIIIIFYDTSLLYLKILSIDSLLDDRNTPPIFKRSKIQTVSSYDGWFQINIPGHNNNMCSL